MDKCSNCNKPGFSDEMMFEIGISNQKIPPGLAALFVFMGELYCYPCYCLVSSTCIHCGDEQEVLIRDKRCKNNLYLCQTCIKEPTCPHLFKCYSDGCMSIEEFAQQEFEIMKEQGGLDPFTDGDYSDWDITL